MKIPHLWRLAIALLLTMTLLPFNRPTVVEAGKNGQQITIWYCSVNQGRPRIEVSGKNQNGKWVSYRFRAKPNSCASEKINNWWWKGTLSILINFENGTKVIKHSKVPTNQKSDWYDVKLGLLSPKGSAIKTVPGAFKIGFCDPNNEPVTSCGLPKLAKRNRPIRIHHAIYFEKVGYGYKGACLALAQLEDETQGMGHIANLFSLFNSGFGTKYRVHQGWYYDAVGGTSWMKVRDLKTGKDIVTSKGILRYEKEPWEFVACDGGK